MTPSLSEADDMHVKTRLDLNGLEVALHAAGFMGGRTNKTELINMQRYSFRPRHDMIRASALQQA